MTSTDAARRNPELGALLALRDDGWAFRPIPSTSGGLAGIAASRVRHQYTDALIITGGSVSAARVDDDGGCVWYRGGNDVLGTIRELRELPEPGSPGAPTLVRYSQTLWLP